MSAMHSRNCESRCLAPHAPVGPICPAASESMASVVMSHCKADERDAEFEERRRRFLEWKEEELTRSLRLH